MSGSGIIGGSDDVTITQEKWQRAEKITTSTFQTVSTPLLFTRFQYNFTHNRIITVSKYPESMN